MHKFHKALTERVQTNAELEALFGEVKRKFVEMPEFAEFTTSLRRQLGDLAELGSLRQSQPLDGVRS